MDLIDVAILSAHALICAVGLFLKPVKSIPYVTGTLAVVVSILLVLIILDGGPGGSLGTHGSWYLILSVVTAGIVPAITLGSSFWSGRFLGCLIRHVFFFLNDRGGFRPGKSTRKPVA